MRILEVRPPWGLEALAVAEAPDPSPGPGEVLVRMRAISLNYRDLMMIEGRYGRGGLPAEGIIPFSDGCGIVEAIGPGVDRFAVGDRVVSLFFQSWRDGPPAPDKTAGTLGAPLPGVGRELAVHGQDGLAKAPDGLTDAEAAALPCAGVTAWRALFDQARPMPGATVLLQGTGGVSIFGLQFAAAAGCRTIVTSSSNEKLARAAALGADHGINYRDTPAWSAPARAATGGRGPDVILDVGGAGTMAESVRAIRMGGHISVIGLLASGEGFNPAMLLGSHATVQGIGVGSRANFEDMCCAIETHAIRPVIDATFAWTDARAALAHLAAGRHFGKIVLEF